MSLFQLPSDVFLEVVRHMEIPDIISLISTCSWSAERVTRNDEVWRRAFTFNSQEWNLFECDAPEGGWKERAVTAWNQRKRVGVIFAYNRIFPPHSGELLNRITEVLRISGLEVYPVLVEQPLFDEPALTVVGDTLKMVSTVLFFTNGYFNRDAVWDKFGDLMGDFVFSGKTVIVGVFGNCTEREAPGGKWRSLNLNPILIHGQLQEKQIYKPFIDYSSSSGESPEDRAKEKLLHPILRGIRSFETSMYVASGSAHPDAEVIASYQSGRPMAVWMKAQKSENGVLKRGGVLSLNIVPSPGDTTVEGGWSNHKKDPCYFLLNCIYWALNNKWAAERIGRRNLPYHFSETIQQTTQQ